MNPLDDFNYFLKENIVKKQTPNKFRSNSLREETINSYESIKDFIEKVGVKDKNANHIIKNSYDVIMELIRSKMILSGYKSSGQGAHAAEVAYLRKLSFKEKDVLFINQLRHFRNGITYYGKKFDSEYALQVFQFLKKVIKKL